MNKQEAFSIGQHTTVPNEIEKASDKKIKYNRDLHSIASSLTNGDNHTNLENYDRTNKLANDVQTSASYLKNQYYNHPCTNKEYTINSSNHYQDLNDKFQQLECKMFEVEKCFKEANRIEMVSEHQKRLSDATSASEDSNVSKNLIDVQNPTRIVNDTRNITEDFDTNGWVRKHNFNTATSTGYENETTKNNYGGGDKISLHKSEANSSTKLSNNTYNTMIDATDQSLFQFPNKRPLTKSYTTMHKFDCGPKCKMPKSLYLEENLKFTDVDLLEKSKKLILGLIDNELQKIEAKPKQMTLSNLDQISKMTADTNNRHLKMECIQNIEKELKVLKQLEESLEL